MLGLSTPEQKVDFWLANQAEVTFLLSKYKWNIMKLNNFYEVRARFAFIRYTILVDLRRTFVKLHDALEHLSVKDADQSPKVPNIPAWVAAVAAKVPREEIKRFA